MKQWGDEGPRPTRVDTPDPKLCPNIASIKQRTTSRRANSEVRGALHLDHPSVPVDANVLERWVLNEVKLPCLPSASWPDSAWTSLPHLPRLNVSLAALVAYLTTCVEIREYAGGVGVCHQGKQLCSCLVRTLESFCGLSLRVGHRKSNHMPYKSGHYPVNSDLDT